jgi:hypothetical protein
MQRFIPDERMKGLTKWPRPTPQLLPFSGFFPKKLLLRFQLAKNIRHFKKCMLTRRLL